MADREHHCVARGEDDRTPVEKMDGSTAGTIRVRAPAEPAGYSTDEQVATMLLGLDEPCIP